MSQAPGLTSLASARLLATLVLLAAPAAQAQDQEGFRVARVFQDGAVVQRGTPIPVWGWAAPSMDIQVSMRDAVARTRAEATGAWRVTLPALPAGGPFEIRVVAGRDTVVVRDVLVGDVWVAAGQSNMEWRLGDAAGGAEDAAAASDPQLRFFKVPHATSEVLGRDTPGGSWLTSTPPHAADFSAIAWYLARDLRRTQGVPIGIIDVSWSGSAIETWLPREATGLSPAAFAAAMDEEQARQARIRDGLRRRLGAISTSDAGLGGGRALWADPDLDDSQWELIRAPGGWEAAGYEGFDGVAWYRTTFELTEAESREAVTLSLGPIDDSDITWVNGDEVGRTDGYAEPRTYALRARSLRAGRNTLVVRVEDRGGGGGLMGSTESFFLEVNGRRRPLAGEWKFKVGAVALRPDEQRINKIPSLAYNLMVHPLLPFPVKGVAWYQGESNANTVAQAEKYRSQFVALIEAWRQRWRTPERPLPFVWVQLTSYGKVDSLPPVEAGWATLRASQHAALSLPRTGEVVSFDLGDPGDLHPKNKRDVGERLALVARGVVYGERVASTGPTYRSHTVVGDSMIVRFANAPEGLMLRGDTTRVGGVAIAGADGRWVWAEAKVRGDEVVAWSPAVTRPVALRYAWSNSPISANLYGKGGLPAAPFQTERR